MKYSRSGESGLRRWRRAAVLGAMVGPLVLAGCGSKGKSAAPTTAATTVVVTTTTAAPVVSRLAVIGVRSGVNQPPFYPGVTVTSVTCGVVQGLGRYVRIDLPPGATGTPARSVMTEPTAVIVLPGAASLIDKTNKTLYQEKMTSIKTATQGAFVLTMARVLATSGSGLAVQVGALQVNGAYACPARDLPYPGA